MAFTQIPLFADNDGADRTRLNHIIQNLNHVNDSKVYIRYNGYGVTRDSGMKIACGVADASSATSSHRTRWVQTHHMFTPGSRPLAFVALGTLRARRSTLAIAQRTGESPILDHTGFQCYARYIHDDIRLPFGPNHLNWMMIGY